MQFPPTLDDWTYETVVEVVRTYEFEPAYFDFKAFLDPVAKMDRGAKDKHNGRIRDAVCAMANTDGGYLLFGVKDREQQVANPVDRIIGLPLGDDLLLKFGHKLSGIDRPITNFLTTNQPIRLPDNADRGIFVVYIPQSTSRPHMVREKGIFYRREANGSNQPMDFQQVRDLMMVTTDRLQRAVFLADQLRGYQRLAIAITNPSPLPEFDNQLQQEVAEGMAHAYRFRTMRVQLLLPDVLSLPMDSSLGVDLLHLAGMALEYNDYLDVYQRSGLDFNAMTPAQRAQHMEGPKSKARDIARLSARCVEGLKQLVGLPPEL